MRGLRRSVRAVLLAAVAIGVLCCWLLPAGARPGGSDALLALLTLGGWGLGVLPLHTDRQPVRPRRRLTAQAQAARGGVEAPLLQDEAER
ncbi:hypothetical protein OG455_13465 [Kitasatospora sp. NBC_01287]|uniref:hypothetical protein n=1 Tax=Kitasatospora sp. NBC_01287 TaxID=2903573 RepID=UPI00224DCA66|nr:hypothetical protein [Kitasatospora sp. NBC_01287]MCX4746521.1 hypothetical protein [Kitasatospora sp. NBC_01287]